MQKAGIIINPDKFHGRNNIPFIKSEKEAKQNREHNKYGHKNKIGRYQQVRQPFFLLEMFRFFIRCFDS